MRRGRRVAPEEVGELGEQDEQHRAEAIGERERGRQVGQRLRLVPRVRRRVRRLRRPEARRGGVAAGEDAGQKAGRERHERAHRQHEADRRSGMNRPKKKNLPASRLSPARNCGPTFMPTENMKTLKKIVPARSGTAIFAPRSAGQHAHAERDDQRRRRRAQADALDLHAPERDPCRDDEEEEDEGLPRQPREEVHSGSIAQYANAPGPGKSARG